MNKKLPRGLWFDADKDKWRVRLYHNGRAYRPTPSFFDTESEALAAHAALRRSLQEIKASSNEDSSVLQSLWHSVRSAGETSCVRLLIDGNNIPTNEVSP